MNWCIIAFLLALAVSYIATPWVRRLALRLNILVHPGGRRVHTRPMPLWGGIAIYGAFALTCLLISKVADSHLTLDPAVIGLLVSGALILTIGMLDDMKEMSAALQVIAIIGAALVLMTFGVRIKFLTNPFGSHETLQLVTGISWFLTLMWIFSLTKTVDFMDGLDGLAAGIGAIAAGILAIMAYYDQPRHPDQARVALMGAALSGACIGFLRFNFNPAKIFMGTGGSQFVGFALAAISITGAFKAAAAIAITLPILVFGVPILDGAFVIMKRFLDRRPVHIADRTHLHHRLLDRGLTHKQVVLLIYFLCLALGGTFLALYWFNR